MPKTMIYYCIGVKEMDSQEQCFENQHTNDLFHGIAVSFMLQAVSPW